MPEKRACTVSDRPPSRTELSPAERRARVLVYNRGLSPAERRWIRRRLGKAWGVHLPPDDGPEHDPGPADRSYERLLQEPVDTAAENGESADQSPRTRGD